MSQMEKELNPRKLLAIQVLENRQVKTGLLSKTQARVVTELQSAVLANKRLYPDMWEGRTKIKYNLNPYHLAECDRLLTGPIFTNDENNGRVSIDITPDDRGSLETRVLTDPELYKLPDVLTEMFELKPYEEAYLEWMNRYAPIAHSFAQFIQLPSEKNGSFDIRNGAEGYVNRISAHYYEREELSPRKTVGAPTLNTTIKEWHEEVLSVNGDASPKLWNPKVEDKQNIRRKVTAGCISVPEGNDKLIVLGHINASYASFCREEVQRIRGEMIAKRTQSLKRFGQIYHVGNPIGSFEQGKRS